MKKVFKLVVTVILLITILSVFTSCSFFSKKVQGTIEVRTLESVQ